MIIHFNLPRNYYATHSYSLDVPDDIKDQVAYIQDRFHEASIKSEGTLTGLDDAWDELEILKIEP